MACGSLRTRNPPGTEMRLIAIAENTNESALITKAQVYPRLEALYPASSVPAVKVPHCVVWVNDLAACSSSRVAIVGRMAARPAVKNGDANISAAISRYSSQGRC